MSIIQSIQVWVSRIFQYVIYLSSHTFRVGVRTNLRDSAAAGEIESTSKRCRYCSLQSRRWLFLEPTHSENIVFFCFWSFIKYACHTNRGVAAVRLPDQVLVSLQCFYAYIEWNSEISLGLQKIYILVCIIDFKYQINKSWHKRK